MKALGVGIVLMATMIGGAWWHGPIHAQSESKTVSFADSTETPAAGRRKLSNREARKLGVTFLSIQSALKELKASGEIDGTESNAELAAAVIDHIGSKQKAAFAKEGLDLDALLGFIEKLIAFLKGW